MSGERVRLGVTVVDAEKGRTLWQETRRYRGLELLDVQDDFTRFVSRALEIELLRFESERVRNLARQNMQAWEHFVLAMDAWEDPTQASFAMAIKEHRLALEMDPNYVLSLGQLATFIHTNTMMGESSDREAARREACGLSDRAIALGQDSALALFSAVGVLAGFCGEAEKAVQISRRMVLAHEDSGYNHTQLGNALFIAGELEEALQVLENAERDFPDNVYVSRYTPLYKSMVYTEREAWDKVLEVSRTSLNLNPSSVFDMYLLANALAVLERTDDAKAMWKQLLVRFPEFSIENYEWYMKQGLLTDERVAPFVRGLKKAALENQ